MRSLKKIDVKKYLTLTLSTTLVSAFFTNGYQEIIGIFAVYIGTVVNQLMLIEGVMLLVDFGNGVKIDKFQIVTVFLGKFVILFGALYIGWHFMGNRVFIAIINYVIHIFFLTLSSKKES